jgi:hypothetical protein
MILSYKHKFAFIKTRKTAGSTIEKILYPILGEKDICSGSTRDGTPNLNYKKDMTGHLPFNSMAYAFDKPMKQYFVFTVERNPWDKCVSAYHWHKQIKPYLTDHGFKAYLTIAKNLLPNDWGYYGGTKTHVFQYDELDQFIPFMNDKFDLNLDPELMNTTKVKSGLRDKKHYSEYYDEESKEFVANLFENEIKEFGYTYDG